MNQLENFTDERNCGICIHCGEALLDGEHNRDHVPSKVLLTPPYPENLPVVEICRQCNSGFSPDEEYLAAFLGAVICGSSEPDPRRFPVASKILEHNSKLRGRIDQAKVMQWDLWRNPIALWKPEMDRVEKVILKNARGHVLYELDVPELSSPTSLVVRPLPELSHEERAHFESTPNGLLWPEGGSRLMQRMATGGLLEGGWIEVQQGVYRYSIFQTYTGTSVRMVLQEYLAAEVLWDDV